MELRCSDESAVSAGGNESFIMAANVVQDWAGRGGGWLIKTWWRVPLLTPHAAYGAAGSRCSCSGWCQDIRGDVEGQRLSSTYVDDSKLHLKVERRVEVTLTSSRIWVNVEAFLLWSGFHCFDLVLWFTLGDTLQWCILQSGTHGQYHSTTTYTSSNINYLNVTWALKRVNWGVY